MGLNTSIYDLKEYHSDAKLRFFFISTGKTDIVKVVEYSYIQMLNNKEVYNLGFGDYNIDTDQLIDNINNNNGDVYAVFNTVLKTIPLFFQKNRHACIIINGSDGNNEFITNCMKNCSRKCEDDECKKFNRRINIYSGYVNKEFDALTIDFQFFGGHRNQYGQTIIEPYIRYKKYDTVLLFKNNP